MLWRIATLTACCCGLYPMFFGQLFSKQIMCYFTTQSNILIAVLFAVLAVGTAVRLFKGKKDLGVFNVTEWIQTGIVFLIQITFLVFAFMLSGTVFSMSEGEMNSFGQSIGNILLHYVVPLMALADWVLFAPHGKLGCRHAALWLTYPAAYVIFAFVRAEIGNPFFDGSRFPYFFMDADVLGWNLLWICPAFFAGYFLLGGLFVIADRAIAKKLAARQAA